MKYYMVHGTFLLQDRLAACVNAYIKMMIHCLFLKCRLPKGKGFYAPILSCSSSLSSLSSMLSTTSTPPPRSHSSICAGRERWHVLCACQTTRWIETVHLLDFTGWPLSIHWSETLPCNALTCSSLVNPMRPRQKGLSSGSSAPPSTPTCK
jgi:hypothetical protein